MDQERIAEYLIDGSYTFVGTEYEAECEADRYMEMQCKQRCTFVPVRIITEGTREERGE
jgi:hypothetical protein